MLICLIVAESISAMKRSRVLFEQKFYCSERRNDKQVLNYVFVLLDYFT